MAETLYQYTDVHGLRGIVENCTMWATDFRHLNDSQELAFVWDAFVDRLKALVGAPDDQYTASYELMLDAIDRVGAESIIGYDQTTFVACFTELGDAISQWSRYAANGHGFALGFDAEKLGALRAPCFQDDRGVRTPVVDQNGEHVTDVCTVLKVSYGDGARAAAVDEFVQVVRRIGVTPSASTNTYNYMAQVAALQFWAPSVKHGSFAEELEHRIVVREHFGGSTPSQRAAVGALDGEMFRALGAAPTMTVDVRFRPGGPGVFRPYVELSLPRDALVSVTLGPSVRGPLAAATVTRLLRRYGYHDVLVKHSELPYQS